MSGLTGYLTESETDLSYVFMPLSSGTQYSTETGFKLSDLNAVFAQYSNYASSKTILSKHLQQTELHFCVVEIVSSFFLQRFQCNLIYRKV